MGFLLPSKGPAWMDGERCCVAVHTGFESAHAVIMRHVREWKLPNSVHAAWHAHCTPKAAPRQGNRNCNERLICCTGLGFAAPQPLAAASPHTYTHTRTRLYTHAHTYTHTNTLPHARDASPRRAPSSACEKVRPRMEPPQPRCVSLTFRGGSWPASIRPVSMGCTGGACVGASQGGACVGSHPQALRLHLEACVLLSTSACSSRKVHGVARSSTRTPPSGGAGVHVERELSNRQAAE